MTANSDAWSGSIMLGTGWALIDTRIGSSRPHGHLAHQISLAVEGDLVISGDADMTVPAGHAVAIPSHVRHRLGPQGAIVRSFYLDPLFRADARMSAGLTPVLLTPAETVDLGRIAGAADAKRWASGYLDRSQASSVDARLSSALAAPDDLSTARALADVACLSPSRLREIVSRDFGVPPAKLLQWLQLQRAMRALVGGGGLADAAAAGGFADQSHFTRRCTQWLGVTPSAGLGGFAFEIVLSETRVASHAPAKHSRLVHLLAPSGSSSGARPPAAAASQSPKGDGSCPNRRPPRVSIRRRQAITS